jgi:hypothetical protein
MALRFWVMNMVVLYFLVEQKRYNKFTIKIEGNLCLYGKMKERVVF